MTLDFRMFYAVVDFENMTINDDKMEEAKAFIKRNIVGSGLAEEDATNPEITVYSMHYYSRIGYVLVATVLPLPQ